MRVVVLEPQSILGSTFSDSHALAYMVSCQHTGHACILWENQESKMLNMTDFCVYKVPATDAGCMQLWDLF